MPKKSQKDSKKAQNCLPIAKKGQKTSHDKAQIVLHKWLSGDLERRPSNRPTEALYPNFKQRVKISKEAYKAQKCGVEFSISSSESYI